MTKFTEQIQSMKQPLALTGSVVKHYYMAWVMNEETSKVTFPSEHHLTMHVC